MAHNDDLPKFALCIRNDDCEDLELLKVYRILPDDRAAEEGYVRVVDESGKDYLYPAGYFVGLTLPQEAQAVLVAAH
jgi:hypothetical protein